MSNTAIIYYSMSGNTAFVADRIKRTIGADTIPIIPEKAYPDKGLKKFLWGGKSAVMAETPELLPYTFDPEKYDNIIFGFPVWASNITPPIRTFIIRHKKEIAEKNIYAFACQSGGGADKALQKLKAALGLDELKNSMILIDPKDKPHPENEKMISEFCEAICPTSD